MKSDKALYLCMGFLLLIVACSPGSGGAYRTVRHHSPWFGYPGYYRERVVVVPDDIDEPIPVQLPAEPDDMPDMGMPDADFD